MIDLKRLIRVLLYPHPAVIIMLLPISVSLLVYSFVFTDGMNAVSYISYGTSAYALTVVCFRAPMLIAFVKSFKDNNRFVRRYFEDAPLRVKISLYNSLIFNTAYAIFQLGLGFYHGSVWFYSLAAYYVTLAVMRFFLLKDVKSFEFGKDRLGELKRQRFCGIALLLMNFALALIVFYISYWGRGFIHHEITTIAMAAHTFGSMYFAIEKLIKYRRYNSPLLSASKAIGLASASVSMLTLETAMLGAFGDESVESFRWVITGLTGGAVCIFILIMAVYMIVKASKEINVTNNLTEVRESNEH